MGFCCVKAKKVQWHFLIINSFSSPDVLDYIISPIKMIQLRAGWFDSTLSGGNERTGL